MDNKKEKKESWSDLFDLVKGKFKPSSMKERARAMEEANKRKKKK